MEQYSKTSVHLFSLFFKSEYSFHLYTFIHNKVSITVLSINVRPGILSQSPRNIIILSLHVTSIFFNIFIKLTYIKSYYKNSSVSLHYNPLIFPHSPLSIRTHSLPLLPNLHLIFYFPHLKLKSPTNFLNG